MLVDEGGTLASGDGCALTRVEEGAAKSPTIAPASLSLMPTAKTGHHVRGLLCVVQGEVEITKNLHKASPSRMRWKIYATDMCVVTMQGTMTHP